MTSRHPAAAARVTDGARRRATHAQKAPPSSLLTRRDRIALSAPVLFIGRCVTAAVTTARGRTSRPWLAMVAVPLAMSATLPVGLWWAWPALIVCAWWWADRAYASNWIVAVEAGIVGSQWVVVGAIELGEEPVSRGLVASIWIGFAAALAAASAFNRRRAKNLSGYSRR